MEILGNRVLVKVDKPEEKTKAGLIIPENAQEQTQRGFVVLTGASVQRVRQDKNVIFDKSKGIKVVVDGNEYLVLDADDLLVIV